MTERDWKLLLLLAEQKSITKTAGVLHLTQPALSARLRNIEDFFGVQVVLRSKKGVQLTAEGDYLVRKAQLFCNEYSAIRDALDDIKRVTSGTLRIGASHYFTKYVLPGLLQKFKGLHPAIEYRVQTGWSRDMVQHVLNNDVHVAFIRGSYNWTGTKRLLFTEHMRIACRARFALGQIPRLPLIQYRNDPTVQLLLDNWWAEHFNVPPQVGMVVDRVDTCLEMIKKGLGYGFLPSTILRGVEGVQTRKMRYRSGILLERSTWMILKEETAGLRLVHEFLKMIDNIDFSDWDKM